jgi:hypothetical protein
MKSSFVDDDWMGLTHQQIYSQIVAELEEEECEGKGHEWRTHIYCWRCDSDFQEYKHDIQRKTAFSLIAEDLKQLLDIMWKEKKIKGSNANELYSRMMKRADNKGYWTNNNSRRNHQTEIQNHRSSQRTY